VDQEKKDILQQKILDHIEKEQEKICTLKELTKPISPENAIGRISRMDAINNKSVNEAALRTAENRLNKLKYALTQIKEEGFGKCKVCNQEIQEGRLLLIPESHKCIRCAAR